MRRLAIVLIGALAIALAAGCSQTPEERFVDHLSAVIDRLEEHAQSPEQAAQAIELYLSDHQHELQALRQELESLDETLSDEEKLVRRDRIEAQTSEPKARLMAIFEKYPQLATSAAVNEALSRLFPAQVAGAAE